MSNINKAFLLIILLLSLFSCSSTRVEYRSIEQSEKDFYLTRPRFEIESSTMQLPSDIYWTPSSAAEFYELEMALCPNFISGKKSYTLRNQNFTISLIGEEAQFYRVRSVFKGQYSQWSKTLVLTPKKNGIIMVSKQRS